MKIDHKWMNKPKRRTIASVFREMRNKINRRATYQPTGEKMMTANEYRIIEAAQNNGYGNAIEGECPWVFAVIATSGLPPKVARGVLSSLTKKGLIAIDDYEGNGNPDDMVFSFTQKGLKLIEDEGLTI